MFFLAVNTSVSNPTILITKLKEYLILPIQIRSYVSALLVIGMFKLEYSINYLFIISIGVLFDISFFKSIFFVFMLQSFFLVGVMRSEIKTKSLIVNSGVGFVILYLSYLLNFNIVFFIITSLTGLFFLTYTIYLKTINL